MTASHIWVCYSQKLPYLPIAVADTAAELAALTGTTKNNIMSTWSKFKSGKHKSTYFYKVQL